MFAIIFASMVLSLFIGLPILVHASEHGLYPDLRAVVPTKLQLVRTRKGKVERERLRFTSAIANTGEGPWALRPEFVGDVVEAWQEIRDEDGNVVQEHLASEFEFHPAHNHWHIDHVAQYEVRKGTPYGKIVGGNSIKVTFCLIDWYRLEGNSPTTEREFWDCYTSYQGISPGWVDQYHQSTEGQWVDLTDVPDSPRDKPSHNYYLVITANADGKFLEKDYTNNTAWTSFRLHRNNQGNRKIKVTGHSDCDSPGLCGEIRTNR